MTPFEAETGAGVGVIVDPATSVAGLRAQLASIVGQTCRVAAVHLLRPLPPELEAEAQRFSALLAFTARRPDPALSLGVADVWCPEHVAHTKAGVPTGAYDWLPGHSLRSGEIGRSEPTSLRAANPLRPSSNTDAVISVIVPGYQAEPFVRTALASLVAQTRQPDQVVFVDDGSTDRTFDEASAFADLLPLKVVRLEENRGLGGARAEAFEHATGDHMLLLDSDDYLFPDHIDVLAGIVGPSTVATARPLRWVEGEAELGPHRTLAAPICAEWRQRRAILAYNFVFISSLFPRELYDRAGGFSHRRILEDWDLWIRMIEAGARVKQSPVPTALYRRHGSALSGQPGALLHQDIDFLGEQLAASTTWRRRMRVRRGLRLRRGQRALLDARAAAADGDVVAARRQFATASWFASGASGRRWVPTRVAGAGLYGLIRPTSA